MAHNRHSSAKDVEDVETDGGGGLRDAGGKVVEETTSAAHEVASAAADVGGRVREATEKGGHAAASAKDTIAGRAQAGAAVLSGNRKRVGAVIAAAVSATLALLAALKVRSRRSRD
jgi:hypothetical protein